MEHEVPNCAGLRFRCMTNALYHTDRRSFLEGVARVSNFLVIMLGASAVADLAEIWQFDYRVIGFGTAAIGALQLVFDFSGGARTHQVLQGRYYSLLAQLDKAVDPNNAFLAGIQSEIWKINADEPPTYRVVDAAAHNKTLELFSRDVKDKDRCHFGCWMSWTRNVWKWSDASFMPKVPATRPNSNESIKH